MLVARSFLDSNIFFYAIDAKDPAKQRRARDLISGLANSGDGVVSPQVVLEFANNAMKKLAFTPEETISMCESFADHTMVRPDLDLVRDSLRWMRIASISFWDACIVAAAEKAECKTLFTEDLSSGQRFGGVLVTNPFA
jgi:predicted nucleic acid-binding protein